MFAVIMKGILSLLAIISIITISMISGPGCANIIPPQGGPRDSIPPVLLKANPVNKSKNFTGNRISFSFDEFVEIKDVQANLIVSPVPNITPVVDYKLNTITVKLKDSLQPNTTYSLDFGNAINDINESNVLKGFTYVFSTGPVIDSFELHGKVILAETGKPDTTLIVMLHASADDSAVIKQKPRYITRLDGKGYFVFKNLPAATYYLYALKDESGTRRYFSDKQLFAFAGKPVTIQAKTDSAVLYAWAGDQNVPQQKQVTTVPTGFGNRNRPGADKRLRYQTNLTNGEQDLLSDLSISFEQPLRLFDSSKLRLYTDSTFTPVSGYTLQKDSSQKKLRLAYSWKENTIYHLIADKDFADDSTGKKLLKTDTLTFKTKRFTDYGTLRLAFRNLDLSKNPVLQFVLNNNVVRSFPLGSAGFSL